MTFNYIPFFTKFRNPYSPTSLPILLLMVLFLTCHQLQSQSPKDTLIHLREITFPEDPNISVKALGSDSLASGFIILIRKEVKKHRHRKHSESIYILEGEGILWLNQKEIRIKPGDYVFIPANTWHAVLCTGNLPLKVLSIQSPHFDGSDREMAE